MTDSNFTFVGISGNIFDYAHTLGKKNEVVFFKRFHTAKDGLISASSIVTAPLISGGMSILTAFFAGCSILSTIGCCLTGDFSNAKEALKDTVGLVYMSALHLINTLLSPLANLIDFIGSVIKTVHQGVSEPAVNNATAAI
jgi:hypothetical protein